MMAWQRKLKEFAGEVLFRGSAVLNGQDAVIESLSLGDGLETPVDPAIRNFELDPPDREGYMLFPVVQGQQGIGSNRHHMLSFAHAFRTRGYEPILPLCNGDLAACFAKPHDGRSYAHCAMCNYSGRRLFSEYGMDPLPFEDMVGGEYVVPDVPSVTELENYRGVPVRELAISSTRRSLMRYEIDLEDKTQCSIVRSFAASAMILTDIAYSILSDYDIKALICFDGTYIYGGSFMYAAANEGVPSYNCSGGYSDSTFMFGRPSNESPLSQFSPRTFIASQLEEPLSENEQTRIDDIIIGRAAGSDVLSPVETASRSVDDEGYRQSIAMYTNLIWDASLEGMNTIFEDPFDWIRSTVNWARSAQDTLVVLKTHPAEAVYGTEQPIAEWIRESLSPIPDNIKILEPDTDVSPYALAKDTDVTVVYNSTIGLEMAYRGKPVVVAGGTHYRGFGFTFDPNTPTEYRTMLENPPQAELDTEQQARARRYAYHLLVRKQLKLPEFFAGKSEASPTHEMLATDECFDRMLEQMLTDEPMIFESES